MKTWPWLPATLAGTAPADVLVSNLEERWTDSGIGEIHGIFADPYSGWAGAFRTGPDRSLLSSITLEHAHWGELPFSPDLRLLLFSLPDVSPPQSDVPVIAELGHPTLNPSPTQFPGFSQRMDYHSLTSVILEGNTTYWIGAYLPPGASDAALMFVHSIREQGAPGWTISDFPHIGYSEGSDITWQTVTGFGQDILKFSVNGVVVPEPEGWALAAAGMIIFICRWRAPGRGADRGPA